MPLEVFGILLLCIFTHLPISIEFQFYFGSLLPFIGPHYVSLNPLIKIMYNKNKNRFLFQRKIAELWASTMHYLQSPSPLAGCLPCAAQAAFCL